MSRKKQRTKSDEPIFDKSINGITLRKKTTKNDVYWQAYIRIRPYPTKTLNERKFRKNGVSWQKSRDAFIAEVEKVAQMRNDSAASDSKKLKLNPSLHIIPPDEIEEAKTVGAGPHLICDIMGCVEEPMKTSDGIVMHTTITDENGNKQQVIKMHQVVQKDNIFDQDHTQYIKYTTRMHYHETYYKWIYPLNKKQTIESLTVADVQKSLDHAWDHIYGNTYGRLLRTWKYIIDSAYKRGWKFDKELLFLDKLPRNGVGNRQTAQERLKGAREDNRLVSDDELRKVIKAINDPCPKNLSRSNIPAYKYKQRMISYAILLLRYTGFRPAELFSLQRENVTIDYDHKTVNIRIDHSMGKREGNELYIHESKSKGSDRTLKLDQRSIPILESVMKLDATRKISKQISPIYSAAGNKYNNADFIFSDYYGRLYDPSKIGIFISKRVKPLGIPFSMYSLRHQVNRDLARFDEVVANAIMGHGAQTIGIAYQQATPEETEEALKSVGNDYTDILNFINNCD